MLIMQNSSYMSNSSATVCSILYAHGTTTNADSNDLVQLRGHTFGMSTMADSGR